MAHPRTYRWVLGSAAALSATLMAAGARAQSTDNSQGHNPPQVQTEGQAPTNLSDRLDRSDGVIRPKGNVDPDIRVTPPDGTPGTMPVIPPPGSPGGDQSIKPK